jgi:hypothetical protein
MKKQSSTGLFMLVIAAFVLLLFTQISVSAQITSTGDQNTTTQNPSEDDLINPDRPGIADGSTVVGKGRLQVESGLQAEFRRNGDTRDHTFFIPTLVRIGIAKRWEARLEGSTFEHDTTLEPGVPISHTSGLAPFSFGVKYHIEDSAGIRKPSLGVIARLFPAWGSGDFRSHHVAADLRLAADWDFAPKLSLNPNIGVGRYEDNQSRTFTAGLFAVTLNYFPTKKLNPFVDMGLTAPEEHGGKSVVIFNGGVAYIIGRNLQLDASIGNGAHGRTPPRPFVAFGISFRTKPFGRHGG